MKTKRTSVGRAIEKLVKAGKPLSGLLVGVASTVGVAAESEVKVPRLAGVPPPRVVATNKVSEVSGGMVRGEPEPIVMGKPLPLASVRPEVKLPPATTNSVNEAEGPMMDGGDVIMGESPAE